MTASDDALRNHASGRRRFLRRLGEAGVLGSATIAGGALVGGPQQPHATQTASDEPADGYHLTDHIRRYYATARFF